MKRLELNLTDCYGIASLVATFDYSKANTNVIYASNGSMKTSLSNTFKKLAQKKEPEERIHGRKPVAHIKMDGSFIAPESIFVIEPFDESFASKNMSTLLVPCNI